MLSHLLVISFGIWNGLELACCIAGTGYPLSVTNSFEHVKFCRSASVVTIGGALHILNIDGITVKALTFLVKSLSSVEVDSVDRDSTIFVLDV